LAYKPLDVDKLRAATEKWVRLPELSAMLGEDAQVKIRRVSRLEYLRRVPMPPEESKDWKNEDAHEREVAWFAALPADQKREREDQMTEALYTTVASAILEPAMTVADVKRLGDDAYVIFSEISAFWTAGAKATSNGGAEQSAEPVAA